jgi:hypothetical protein
MMRLARRASLLVAFFLLTSAATAYAECAWVLWRNMYLFDRTGASRGPRWWQYRWRGWQLRETVSGLFASA